MIQLSFSYDINLIVWYNLYILFFPNYFRIIFYNWDSFKYFVSPLNILTILHFYYFITIAIYVKYKIRKLRKVTFSPPQKKKNIFRTDWYTDRDNFKILRKIIYNHWRNDSIRNDKSLGMLLTCSIKRPCSQVTNVYEDLRCPVVDSEVRLTSSPRHFSLCQLISVASKCWSIKNDSYYSS